jgi:hypothetical protein
MTLSITTLCTESQYAQCHYAECHYAECHYAECHYAECHISFIAMQNADMLNIVVPHKGLLSGSLQPRLKFQTRVMVI